MKTFFNPTIFAQSKFLLFHENKLKEVEFQSMRIEPYWDEHERYMKVNHYIVSHNDAEIKINNDAILYLNVKDYENGKHINKTSTISFAGFLLGVNLDYQYYHDGDVVLEYKWWKAIEYIDYNFITKDVKVNGFVPKKLYETKEYAMLYNPTIYTDIDGNKVRKEGILSKILPNEEQKELIQQFRELVSKMNKANLKAFYDYRTFLFFNTENVSDYYAGYEDVGIKIDEYHEDNIVREFDVFDCGDGFCVDLEQDNQ